MYLRPPGGGAIALADSDRAAALAELDGYMRRAGGDDDATLSASVAAALAIAEAFVGTVLIARDFVDMVATGARWRALAMRPVREITQVDGVPAEGASFALAVDAYAVDIDADSVGWVRVTRAGAAGRAKVAYRAGVADDWPGLPQPIRQGVVMLAAHLLQGDDTGATPPVAVTALWRPFRVIRLDRAVRA